MRSAGLCVFTQSRENKSKKISDLRRPAINHRANSGIGLKPAGFYWMLSALKRRFGFQPGDSFPGVTRRTFRDFPANVFRPIAAVSPGDKSPG
ncbi:hypothetical protein DENIS_2692 [Desulfonema ishimotonii]|uniref:Uncharacterized protein n=1 Tax=Desulfonema ishimotonii TaxID=45657 RepID=A0A401FXN4_9BACT|nr:hypothetical protein DENIS_2692 [Desulfonema ishimotonii]